MKPLGKGEVGGKAALPAWIAFMREALRDLPDSPLPMPAGVVAARIDPDTGMRVAGGQGGVFEVFRDGEVPEVGGYYDDADPYAADDGVGGLPAGRASRAAPLQDLF